MAYKQKPGRGNNSKTGHGVPAPFKQEDGYNSRGNNPTTANRFNNWDTNNPNFKLREYAEKSAQSDSSAVASKAIKFGIGKREAGKMGNMAANETRRNFGAGDLNVTAKTVPGGEEYNQKVKPGINPRTGAKVKVVPPTKQVKKAAPAKKEEGGFLDTVKSVGKSAIEGVKSAGRAYVKFSKDLDRQADRGPATQLKSVAKKKMAGKKAPAKMKKC